MKSLFIQTLLFILNKWDYSYQDILKPTGKILFFIPWFINSILTQILFFSIFPLVMLYVDFLNITEPFIKVIEEHRDKIF